MESLFEKCLRTTSYFEGNDNYGNIAKNIDDQILSIGCLCFTVKSRLAKRLFGNVITKHPKFLSSLSDEAVNFVVAIINDDYNYLLKKQLERRWLLMAKNVMRRDEVIESQKALAYEVFFIPALAQTKKIRKEYPFIQFSDLTTIFAFDVLVQNGSFKGSISQSKKLSSDDIARYIGPKESLSDEQVALIKILHSRALVCPTTYRQDVLKRKLAIIKKAENIVVHGKKFSFSKLVGEI